jgi:hypothetical protein
MDWAWAGQHQRADGRVVFPVIRQAVEPEDVFPEPCHHLWFDLAQELPMMPPPQPGRRAIELLAARLSTDLDRGGFAAGSDQTPVQVPELVQQIAVRLTRL